MNKTLLKKITVIESKKEKATVKINLLHEEIKQFDEQLKPLLKLQQEEADIIKRQQQFDDKVKESI